MEIIQNVKYVSEEIFAAEYDKKDSKLTDKKNVMENRLKRLLSDCQKAMNDVRDLEDEICSIGMSQ